MEQIMNLSSLNTYLIMFLATIIDDSGVPLGILSAGIFISLGKVNLVLSFIVISISLIISDLIFILCGRYLAYRHSSSKNYYSTLYRINKKILTTGSQVITEQSLSFYLLGKFIPYIGKFLPLLIGYQDHIDLRNAINLMIGNTIYVITFMILGAFFGNLIIEYSFVISIVSITTFCIIYKILLEKGKNKNIVG